MQKKLTPYEQTKPKTQKHGPHRLAKALTGAMNTKYILGTYLLKNKLELRGL